MKSAVDRPMNRKFLGFTVSRNGAKLKVADKALEKRQDRVRELTRRTRGTRMGAVVAELRDTLWLESVLRHRRCAESSARHRQMGTAQVALLSLETMGRGRLSGTAQAQGIGARSVEHEQVGAWGPWRLSKTPALAIALPLRFFINLGRPSLAPR